MNWRVIITVLLTALLVTTGLAVTFGGVAVKPWPEKPFIVTSNDPSALDDYFRETYKTIRQSGGDQWARIAATGTHVAANTDNPQFVSADIGTDQYIVALGAYQAWVTRLSSVNAKTDSGFYVWQTSWTVGDSFDYAVVLK